MDTLTIILLLLIALTAFIYYSLKPRPFPGIPHNRKLPWMSGDAPFVARVAKETGLKTHAFEVMVQKFGPISQLVFGPGNTWISKIGFGNSMVILSDAQEIHDILVNRSTQFDRAYLTMTMSQISTPYGMLSLPTDNMLKRHKRWFGPSMTAPYLARMVPRMTESIRKMLELWSISSQRLRKAGSNERAFNAMDDIHLASIDVISSITFGASFNSIPAIIEFMESNPQSSASQRPPPPALTRSLQQLVEIAGESMFFPIPALVSWWTRTFNAEWNHAYNTMYGFLAGKLDRAREAYQMSSQTEDKRDARLADNVLEMILEKEREDRTRGEEVLSRSEILDELATYAIAGSETTATTVQWSMKILARHPEVQRKLHRELVDRLPPLSQRPATFEELSSTERLPYLSAVAYEVLRVSRTVAVVTRDATRDTTILGYPIPKGTMVVMALAHTQQYESASYKDVADGFDMVRSESSRRSGRKVGYWEEEDHVEFKPERWLTADGQFDPNSGPWMPFSFGFRGCFGQKLAILELRMFLAFIHTTFFLDKVPEELDSFAAHESLTTHPTQCYVRPIPWSEIDHVLL